MNRFCTLTLLLIFCILGNGWAQQRTIDYPRSEIKDFIKPSPNGIQFRMEMDTLLPPAFDLDCGSQVASFSITDNWGNVSGMNQFMDLQKAQRFDYDGASTYTVNEVGVFFSRANVVGDGELKINIYEVGPSGAPGALLGSSESMKVSEIAVPGPDDPLLSTAFEFETPPTVMSNQFFVSVDFTALYATQDTVALFNTPDDCGDGTSTWELFGDGTTWDNYVNSWDLNADLGLVVVVEKLEDIVIEENDTILPPIFGDTCSQTVTFFGVQDGWGFVAGTNSFGDLEKAQRFDYPNGELFGVTQVGISFHQASVVGDGEVTIKIYDVGANGGPDELLGTSLPINTSQLAVPSQGVAATLFSFPEIVALSGSQFFVSVDLSDLYTKQDTVGIWHTRPDCGNGTTTWELFSDGTTWVPFTDQSSWQIDVDLFAFAILEKLIVDNTNNLSPEEAGLHLANAFPNPASDHLNINYTLDQRDNITIGIHSANGQLLQNHNLGNRLQGEHREILDLSNLNNGLYFYSFATNKVRVMRRFVIQK